MSSCKNTTMHQLRVKSLYFYSKNMLILPFRDFEPHIREFNPSYTPKVLDILIIYIVVLINRHSNTFKNYSFSVHGIL